jgi:hypothetical protein
MHVLTADDLRSGARSAALAQRRTTPACRASRSTAWTSPPIDAMLVDVEGMENKLLAGARMTLQRDLPLLLIEIWGGTRSARRRA